MKMTSKLFTISILFTFLLACTTANAELTTYEYSGVITETIHPDYHVGQYIKGSLTISTDLTEEYQDFYVDTNSNSNFTFGSGNSEFVINNTQENEFNYETAEYMAGLDFTSVVLTARIDWGNEIVMRLEQLPGRFDTIPNPLKPELASDITLFAAENELYSILEITQMSQIKTVEHSMGSTIFMLLLD